MVGLGGGGILLVAQCKGVGKTEGYPSWYVPSRSKELDTIVEDLAENNKTLLHHRWGEEFEQRWKNNSNIIWIVFPGTFIPKSKPKPNGQGTRVYCNILGQAQAIWGEHRKKYNAQAEGKLLKAAEQYYSGEHKKTVCLKPVHVLLHEIYMMFPEDMIKRRVRYPDTALEMLRWMVRTTWGDCLNLQAVQNEWQEKRP